MFSSTVDVRFEEFYSSVDMCHIVLGLLIGEELMCVPKVPQHEPFSKYLKV